MNFPCQNAINLASLHSPNFTHDRKTSSFYASHLLNSKYGRPDERALKNEDSIIVKPKAGKNCLDALLTTNSSLSSEQFDDIQAKDLNEETKKLCKFFKKNKYPNKEDLQELARLTNRTVKHLETWFKNRRRALAMKGLLPSYQRKNKFSKQEVETLMEFFENLKKPKKHHFEQIHQKMNNVCSIKNIKNWFNHYKKKIKMGVQERKKKVKVESNNSQKVINQCYNLSGTQDAIQTNPIMQNQANVQENSSFMNSISFSSNPMQNFQTPSFSQQQKTGNNRVILPVYPNYYPSSYAYVQKPNNGPPIMLQNYNINPTQSCTSGLPPNNCSSSQMNYNLAAMPTAKNNIMPHQMAQNFGYFVILNQPNVQNLQNLQNYQNIQNVPKNIIMSNVFSQNQSCGQSGA